MINDVTNNDVMYNDVRLKHEVPSHNRGTDYEKFSDFWENIYDCSEIENNIRTYI